jgi:hypothetical protein
MATPAASVPALVTEEATAGVESAKPVKDRETIELGEYLGWIKNEIDSEEACLELPVTLTLLISFACLALMHLRQADVFTVEGAISFDIEENANFAWSNDFGHKTINDVNSVADFYSWMRIGFLPLVVQHAWGYSENLQTAYNSLNVSHPFDSAGLPSSVGAIPVRDDYLHYNRIIGGIRMQQEIAPSGYDLCRIPGNIDEDIWKEWLGKPCMPSTPQYLLSPQPEEAETWGSGSSGPKRVEWLITAVKPLDQLQKKVIDMEDGCSQLAGKNASCSCQSCDNHPWVDESTQRIEIGFVSYNYEYGLISLVTANFFFNRAGQISKLVHVQSSWAQPFGGKFFTVAAMLFCDFVYLAALGKVFVAEVKEIIKTIQSSKESWYKAVYEDYVAFWNIVDWISILCALLVVTMFFILLFSTFTVNDAIRTTTSLDGATASEYEVMLADLVAKVEDMCSAERGYRTSFMFYPMVVMMRLFKSFDAQPRLAVVTRTLYLAAPGIVHFSIVFASVYICMAVNGVLLFGQNTEAFADFWRGFYTCFRVMFGDWDWVAMKEVGRQWALPWFWIFNMMIAVILLNMLLAILMDAYTEVKNDISDAQTLPTQVSEMIRRHRQSKRLERVKLNDIWASYLAEMKDEKDMLNNKDHISSEDVIAKVKGIPRIQAERTIKNAKKVKERRESKPFTQDEVLRNLGDINVMTTLVKENARRLRKQVEVYDSSFSQAELAANTSSVEQRQQMIDVVQGIVGALGNEVSEVLTQEMQLFNSRQNDIEVAQRNMVVCIRDSHQMMQQVCHVSDLTMQELQHQKEASQRRQVRRQNEGDDPTSHGAALGFPLSVCDAPNPAQPTKDPASRTKPKA